MKRAVIVSLWVSAAVGVTGPLAAQSYRERAWQVRHSPRSDFRRPDALLIGDSILYGYLPTVEDRLSGTFNVHAWVTPTHQGQPAFMKHLEAVLGMRHYSVVHINLGLHGWEPGEIPESRSRILMEDLAAVLQRGAPDATLIWATTTPTTREEINPVILRRNVESIEVMTSRGVGIHDLHAAMMPHLRLLRPDGVHWTPAGASLQGVAVANVVSRTLSQ